jgi:hypothetical protein
VAGEEGTLDIEIDRLDKDGKRVRVIVLFISVY